MCGSGARRTPLRPGWVSAALPDQISDHDFATLRNQGILATSSQFSLVMKRLGDELHELGWNVIAPSWPYGVVSVRFPRRGEDA